MRRTVFRTLALVALLAIALGAPARGEGPTGLDFPIGDPSRSEQEYVWISNASNLPLFVERVYPGLESARKALNVKVRISGPTAVDLGAFITTVDAECTKNPAGVIVVGGWDDALASEVDKCIDKQVPTVVTDGDLPMSKRLTYLGTNWYNLGYQHGQYQCRYHAEAGLEAGEIGTISFLAASNFILARQGLRDALAKECPGITVVADEESGTNVEQVAANTAAIIQGHPNLTGMVGFDSEAGPGIVRAVTEAGRAGQIIVTSNEAGRDFLNSIKDGTVKMINMEKYETMDFFAVLYLYTFHNDIIRALNMDHWLQNPLPAIGDSGLIFVTADNVDTILAATAGAQSTATGLDVPIGDPSRSEQEYVWISNASNLPLFVERVYPGLESARKALNVKVRISGPTAVDLGAFITTVDAECTKNPAGVIVVGGWDDALASEVDKCIDKQVPTVVTDGDLPMSKRLTYLGTNWYNLGYQHGQYQCRYHAEAGLEAGEIGTISFLAASNFILARQGLRDALAKECPGITVVADEESGTNVEQVAANTAAIIQGHPNLTGMVGFDSEAGPGIVRAVTEAGRAGQIIVTSNEAGRDFLNSIKDGTVKMINMEKYETMDFFAVAYLYTFHNDIIRALGMDHWLQNPLPAIGDSGLIFVTADNVDTILAATAGAQ